MHKQMAISFVLSSLCAENIQYIYTVMSIGLYRSLTELDFVKGVIINKTTTCFGYFVSPSSGCLPFLLDVYICNLLHYITLEITNITG
jgi:hypothetical protein